MSGFLLSIDQGTTGSTALLLYPRGEVLGRANREFPQHFPKPGWVEHDAMEIWARTQDVVKAAVEKAGAGPGDIASVGVTNQRETTVVWDRVTGEAVAPAIVWQSRQTAEICDRLRAAGHQDWVRERTGLEPDRGVETDLWIQLRLS